MFVADRGILYNTVNRQIASLMWL